MEGGKRVSQEVGYIGILWNILIITNHHNFHTWRSKFQNKNTPGRPFSHPLSLFPPQCSSTKKVSLRTPSPAIRISRSMIFNSPSLTIFCFSQLHANSKRNHLQQFNYRLILNLRSSTSNRY